MYLMAIWYILRPFGIFCGYLEYFVAINQIFAGILKPIKVTITNVNMSKFVFIRKFRTKKLHTIDPRSTYFFPFWYAVPSKSGKPAVIPAVNDGKQWSRGLSAINDGHHLQ
jgi:hypothetical protein